jgi:hypothetical protein
MSSLDPSPALRQIRQRLMQLGGELDQVLDELEARSSGTAPARPALARTEAIVQVLDEAGRPLSLAEIRRALLEKGFRDEKDLTRVTTYQLWRRDRVVKIATGLYCHPGHVPTGTATLPHAVDRSPPNGRRRRDHAS